VSNARILLVEDEPGIVDFVRRGFEADGFAVEAALDGIEGERLALADGFDAIVLDLMLPGRDGLEVLASVRRAKPEVPVIVLTARGEIEDRVAGLDAGADDYLVKPFAMSELIARTKALLRRPGGALGTMLKAGNISFDTIGRDVSVDNVPLALPRRETAILEHLMRRLGRVVPKSVLEEKLYGMDDELESNAIPVHVHHLRHKLVDGGATAEIHTVRGVGYLLSKSKP
jgi:DNA-binding response OmpR family regulator